MSVFHLEMRAAHWALVHEGSGRVIRRYRTRREALTEGAADVARRGGLLVVHRRDGGVREWRSFNHSLIAPALASPALLPQAG